MPICVDTTVNPLFCGGCNSRCPFDQFGATSCGQFGNGVNATAAACKVTCSPSYPTQCGTIANYNASSAKLPPTSNCVNTNQDVNNCGGVREREEIEREKEIFFIFEFFFSVLTSPPPLALLFSPRFSSKQINT